MILIHFSVPQRQFSLSAQRTSAFLARLWDCHIFAKRLKWLSRTPESPLCYYPWSRHKPTMLDWVILDQMELTTVLVSCINAHSFTGDIIQYFPNPVVMCWPRRTYLFMIAIICILSRQVLTVPRMAIEWFLLWWDSSSFYRWLVFSFFSSWTG